MAYSDTQIDSIISETLAKFQNQPSKARGNWLCDTMEEAIAAAKAAQKELIKLPLEKRGRLILSYFSAEDLERIWDVLDGVRNRK